MSYEEFIIEKTKQREYMNVIETCERIIQLLLT